MKDSFQVTPTTMDLDAFTKSTEGIKVNFNLLSASRISLGIYDEAKKKIKDFVSPDKTTKAETHGITGRRRLVME